MGNKMNKVLPGLYIGSARDARDVEELRENKITHILSVFENAKPDLPDKEYMCLSVADSPSQNIVCYFSQCNVFIHKARRAGNVLVHCQMGVSRSATIVVAYLMTVTRLSWKDAVAALKAVRPFVSPNLGFQKQLMIYEKKYVEEERTRLKTLFPRSQFNDVAHCVQLLETYRLTRLRTEQPMDVDVYPLPLDAYGAQDFATLRLVSPPANVVLCGPVSDPASEEDCLSRRLERIQLGETFASVDTFSGGPRPSSVIIGKTKSPMVCNPSASWLHDVQDNGGTVERERVSGNALLSGSLKNPVIGSGLVDPKVSDEAALDLLFSNSVDVSKNSGNDGNAEKGATRELTSQHAESSDAASVESMFSNSLNKGSSEVKRDGSPGVKESPQQIQVSNRVHLTEKELREIGRAYLRKHVRIWHDLSDDDDDDDDDDRNSSAARITNNNRAENKIASNNPRKVKFACYDPIQLIKISSINPTETTVASNDTSQVKAASNEPTQLIKITSNGPPQDTIASNGPPQMSCSGSSVEAVTVLPKKSKLDKLFHG